MPPLVPWCPTPMILPTTIRRTLLVTITITITITITGAIEKALHEGSTLVVVINALRLLAYQE